MIRRTVAKRKGARAVVPLLRDLGERVRQLRKQRDLSLRALADRAALSERFVAELEAGRGNISVLNLAQVASALGTTPGALLAGSSPGRARGVVALLGLRGAGKSSVGRALAERLAVPFLELDQLVEAEAGMRLSELFAIHGEGYFRTVELAVLRRALAQHPRAVIATGGGLVTSPDAFSLLRDRARTVWLKANAEEHWERVVGQGDLRPMRNRPHAMAELKRRLREREPLYAQADVTCDTSGGSVAAIASELVRRLERD